MRRKAMSYSSFVLDRENASNQKHSILPKSGYSRAVRVACSSGTRSCDHQSACPPMQLVEHVLRILLQVRKFFYVLALLPDGHEIGALNMDAVARRSHLQLHATKPQVLD